MVDPAKVRDVATGTVNPGSNVIDDFFRRFGDNDGNDRLDRADSNALIRTFRVPHAAGYNAAFDLDADGVTFQDRDDYFAFIERGLTN